MWNILISRYIAISGCFIRMISKRPIGLHGSAAISSNEIPACVDGCDDIMQLMLHGERRGKGWPFILVVKRAKRHNSDLSVYIIHAPWLGNVASPRLPPANYKITGESYVKWQKSWAGRYSGLIRRDNLRLKTGWNVPSSVAIPLTHESRAWGRLRVRICRRNASDSNFIDEESRMDSLGRSRKTHDEKDRRSAFSMTARRSKCLLGSQPSRQAASSGNKNGSRRA